MYRKPLTIDGLGPSLEWLQTIIAPESIRGRSTRLSLAGKRGAARECARICCSNRHSLPSTVPGHAQYHDPISFPLDRHRCIVSRLRCMAFGPCIESLGGVVLRPEMERLAGQRPPVLQRQPGDSRARASISIHRKLLREETPLPPTPRFGVTSRRAGSGLRWMAFGPCIEGICGVVLRALKWSTGRGQRPVTARNSKGSCLNLMHRKRLIPRSQVALGNGRRSWAVALPSSHRHAGSVPVQLGNEERVNVARRSGRSA